MNRIGDLGEKMMEQGQAVVQSAKKQVQQTAQSMSSQVISAPADAAAPDIAAKASDAIAQSGGDLAALEQNLHQNLQQAQQQPQNANPKQQVTEADPLKKSKIDAVRKKLWHEQHKTTYYDPLIQKIEQLKHEHSLENRQQQEVHAEQVKQIEDFEQKKKDEPIALQRAKRTTEINRGASG